jgi:hypothetical protein
VDSLGIVFSDPSEPQFVNACRAQKWLKITLEKTLNFPERHFSVVVQDGESILVTLPA